MNHLDLVLRDRPIRGSTTNRDLRYLAVHQISFKSLFLQELLLSGIHYQIPSRHWLWYHASQASRLLYRVRRRANSIAAISTRSLAIITQIQIHVDAGQTVVGLLNKRRLDKE